MKVRSAIKKICGYCQIIRRGKNLFVRCQVNKRHKQRQGFHSTNVNFELGDKNHCECPNSIIIQTEDIDKSNMDDDPIKDFKNENKLI